MRGERGFLTRNNLRRVGYGLGLMRGLEAHTTFYGEKKGKSPQPLLATRYLLLATCYLLLATSDLPTFRPSDLPTLAREGIRLPSLLINVVFPTPKNPPIKIRRGVVKFFSIGMK